MLCPNGAPLVALLLLGPVVAAPEADPWRRGAVRELLLGNLPQTPADLEAWRAAGVTSYAGLKPETAHQHGALARSWFTMNYMDSRNQAEDWIRARAAVSEAGGYLRPNDPLFPTVGQYGWTACVNNPLWVEHSRDVFRKMAEAGYDGAHIDFASHYEPCFCEHCRARWTAFAAARALPGDLVTANRATDLRSRMLLREFRIRSVMDFLGDLRATARASKPVFGLDGTWHHDSGSTYQWAYGEHFDLMCIEGTTHGPFPPDGTQLLWLKLAHALSERADRRPAAMSVTYHLLRNEQGALHHGRMAPDRVKVALAEILSQGGVSWLGLGGPGTGSLIREHVDAVRAAYRTAADLEPLLIEAEEVGEIGLLFSPRSYLLASAAYRQAYAIAHTLLKAHVPFRVLSDVDLRPAKLAGLAGLVVLDAPALTTAAGTTIEAWVRAGGQALVLGGSCATVGEDWLPRATRPTFAVPPEGAGVRPPVTLGQGQVRHWVEDLFAGQVKGATQLLTLNQTAPQPLAIEGWSRAEGVGGGEDSNYSLYVDLVYQDGTPLWGQVATFPTGTHDWQFRRTIITPAKPVKTANVHLLFRQHGGTAWFRDVRCGVWDPERQEITTNLLQPTYRLPDGQVLRAGGAGEGGGQWSPYGAGYELENALDLGLLVKLSTAGSIAIGSMAAAPGESEAKVLELLAPLRAPEPWVTVTGAGADRVSVDLQRAGDRLLVHLFNHQAELHPELPEAEQQARERSLPATDLTVSLRVPGLRLQANGLAVHGLGQAPAVRASEAGVGVALTVPRLEQYAVVVLPVAGG